MRAPPCLAWGPSCRLVLRFEPVFTLKGRHCHDDRPLCDAAAEVAVHVAAAFHRWNDALDKTPFRYGPPAPVETVQQIKALQPDERLGSPIPAFPTFNGPIPEEYSVYSNDFELIPLMLNGKAYAAGIGYGGVGWREIGDILFSVYKPNGQVLKPLAGFSVKPGIKRLAAAGAIAPRVGP